MPSLCFTEVVHARGKCFTRKLVEAHHLARCANIGHEWWRVTHAANDLLRMACRSKFSIMDADGEYCVSCLFPSIRRLSSGAIWIWRALTAGADGCTRARRRITTCLPGAQRGGRWAQLLRRVFDIDIEHCLHPHPFRAAATARTGGAGGSVSGGVRGKTGLVIGWAWRGVRTERGQLPRWRGN